MSAAREALEDRRRNARRYLSSSAIRGQTIARAMLKMLALGSEFDANQAIADLVIPLHKQTEAAAKAAEELYQAEDAIEMFDYRRQKREALPAVANKIARHRKAVRR